MASDDKAKWTNGKRTITGRWEYIWHRDAFVVQIDGNDDLGIRRRPFIVYRDTPEFGEWKLVKKEKESC